MSTQNPMIALIELEEDFAQEILVDIEDVPMLIKAASGSIRPVILSYTGSTVSLFDLLGDLYESQNRPGQRKPKARDWK